MEPTENENKAAGAPSALNVGLESMDWNQLSREVAREAGVDPDGGFSQDGQHPWVVAAIRIATLRERKACAAHVEQYGRIAGLQAACKAMADGIRMRSNEKIRGGAAVPLD